MTLCSNRKWKKKNKKLNRPRLKSLHSDETLNPVKLEKFRKLSTEELIDSLQPGRDGALRTRPDGTVLEGHHRLTILRERGIDVDALLREIVAKDSPAT